MWVLDGQTWPVSCPPLDSKEELRFLSTMLQELNLEFALQLEAEPCVDRLLNTLEVPGASV